MKNDSDGKNFEQSLKTILTVSRKQVEAESTRQRKAKKNAKDKADRPQPQKS